METVALLNRGSSGGEPTTPHPPFVGVKEGETFDTLFDGKLKFIQDRRGYRFSLDAILLAAFLEVKRGDVVADLGTGNGVIPIILAHHYPGIRVTGFELQATLFQRARRSIEVNGFGERIQIVAADIRKMHMAARPESFDLVVCNPPYRRPSSGRLSPNAEKQIARHECAGGLEDFLAAAAFVLRRKGRFGVIYPATRSIELFTTLRESGLEPKRVRMVHSRMESEASLVLTEAVKGGRSGVEVSPPLIVYSSTGIYTHELAAMLAGSAPQRS
jgi:tRNA1Val (adenine37-N6)-methyltransferase